jgi:hypothetical protein
MSVLLKAFITSSFNEWDINPASDIEGANASLVEKPVDSDVQIAALRPCTGLKLDLDGPPPMIIYPHAGCSFSRESERLKDTTGFRIYHRVVIC